MRALVLGCGEMGRVAIADLIKHGVFRDVVVATRTPSHAEQLLADLHSWTVRTSVVAIDVQDERALAQCMKGFDVVCNMAGPNYLNAVPVAKAAITAGVSLVDVSDDWEATLEILNLHGAAEAAGVTVIVGLGASPGVTNVLARYAVDKLDTADEVHTSWVMRGSDLGGPALSAHLLHSLPHRAFVFANKAMQEVRPFIDGRETIRFPELGDVEVTHIGHPEPFTLSRYLPGLSYADDKAAFLPVELDQTIVELGKVAMSGMTVRVDGHVVDPMDFASTYLYNKGKSMTTVSKTGALRTEVRGYLEGKRTRIIYSAAGRICTGTGVPASIGAHELAIGNIKKPGVFPPEACIDPESFLTAVSTRDVGEVEEQIIQE